MPIKSLPFLAIIAAMMAMPHAASATGFGETLGGMMQQKQTGTTNPLNSQIDAIAGEGTADVINGNVSPEVALAGQQFGIPAAYLPQVQELYNMYKGTGSVSASNVQEQAGLSSWLDKKPSLNSETLAKGLNALFAGGLSAQ